MTVARLNSELTEPEFVRWQIFYARRKQREELEAMKAKR